MASDTTTRRLKVTTLVANVLFITAWIYMSLLALVLIVMGLYGNVEIPMHVHAGVGASILVALIGSAVIGSMQGLGLVRVVLSYALVALLARPLVESIDSALEDGSTLLAVALIASVVFASVQRLKARIEYPPDG